MLLPGDTLFRLVRSCTYRAEYKHILNKCSMLQKHWQAVPKATDTDAACWALLYGKPCKEFDASNNCKVEDQPLVTPQTSTGAHRSQFVAESFR